MPLLSDSPGLIALALGAALGNGCGGSKTSAPRAPHEVHVPNPDVWADTLQARKKAQLETVRQFIDSVEVDWPSGRRQVETERRESNTTPRIVEARD